MAIAQQLAGYTLGQADLLRRAMGKKKKEILDKEYVPFSDGMRARGYSEAAIKKLWDMLVPFSDYAFNKAHTAGYGLVSYWTAFLKANYPAEYMAALLTSDPRRQGQVRALSQRVPPHGHQGAAARRQRVRLQLHARAAPTSGSASSAIRNVGENVVASIAATRSAKGRFADFYDFLRKVDPVACNKKTVESLIKAGAFDSLGHTRRGLLAVHAEAIDSFMATKRNEAHGQFDLFVRPMAGRRRRRRAGRGPRRHPRGPAGGVGQDRPAGLRARDARSLRLRPPAVRRRARDRRGRRLLHRRAHRVRGPRRRLARHDRRADQRPAAQGDQEGRRVGDRHRRGPRGRDRGDVLPADLPAVLHDPGRGRRRHRPRPAGPARRRARS